MMTWAPMVGGFLFGIIATLIALVYFVEWMLDSTREALTSATESLDLHNEILRAALRREDSITENEQ